MARFIKVVVIVLVIGLLTACAPPTPENQEMDSLGELQKTDGFEYGPEFRQTVRVWNCDNLTAHSDILTEAKRIERDVSWIIVGEEGLGAYVTGAGVEARIAGGYELEVGEQLAHSRELELPVNANSSAEYEIVWRPILWSGFIPFQSGNGRIEYIYQQVAFGEVTAIRDRTAEDCLTSTSAATATLGVLITEPLTEPLATQLPELIAASPSPIPLPTAAIPQPVQLELVGPQYATYWDEIAFSWKGPSGLTYRVQLRNPERQFEYTGPWDTRLTWAFKIPAEQYGNWVWWVESSDGRLSQQGTFVFDPSANSGGPIGVYDLNHDCRIDGADLEVIANYNYGCSRGETCYSGGADFDGDGYISDDDVEQVSRRLGRVVEDCTPQ